ncbi:hypothetical protein P7C70_g5127, partial [Phenoliferia sp. Uapishka_3]
MRLRPKKDKLTVAIEQDTLFLHPQPSGSDRPSDDPILRGTVTLSLGAPRRVTRIQCQLKGVVTLGCGDYRYQTDTSLLKTLSIDVGGERLAKGDHSYHFSFIVPSSTATQERSKYGTCRHTVQAWCDGLGSFGSTLTSPNTPVWLIANPAAPGELPQGLEVVVQDFGGDIGPVAMHLSSQHLTDLDADVGIVTPPIQRKSLFYADQTTPFDEDSSLLDRGNLGRGASLPLAYESRRLSPKPLAELQADKEWSYSRIVRIPDDDHVRPTTLEGTDTRIRVTHKFVAEVRYRMNGSKKDMVLEMSTNVVIASFISAVLLLDRLAAPSLLQVFLLTPHALSVTTLTPLAQTHSPHLPPLQSVPSTAAVSATQPCKRW